MRGIWIIVVAAALAGLLAGVMLGMGSLNPSKPDASVGANPVRSDGRDQTSGPSRGVWVTVFSERKVLYSPEAVAELVTFCRHNNISDIYLQVYRGGEAYFKSQLAGGKKYESMLKSAGQDPLEMLLKQAHEHKIRVHAWINVLSLAQNRAAPILGKYGSEVLTRDQHRRTSIRTDGADRSDEFYLRDDQIFLEAGDERVTAFMSGVLDELLSRYPGFDGVHFDYIRYPYSVPLIPDGRFVKYGLAYGYGQRNVERFTRATGLDPVKGDPYENQLHLKWDNWKRVQVNDLIKALAARVRRDNAARKVSCAVVPDVDRAYSAAFQDWALWLEQKVVDYVVLMNYTRDERQSAALIRAARVFSGKGEVHAGIGAFLLKDPQQIARFYEIARAASADGVVFFSYDDIFAVKLP